ncbi:MAG: hypothetical protein ACD_42C00322G0008 [uncultured bacterium]|nr:MAG: hypothetical protein ACD_42C00322G0008 [uncultured bacterium]OGT32698.1 MAG: hypothetical protein A3C44_00265 [Gammaproteobacteria bacterium RIFCSPHIGHO2_02_FULL_39_13]OGT48663.1 MAG: hypothetical protein A3E53_05235 [Gammaproteobacteria bacterium RIFCSPHIGHO2_12_FULL_39_24]
MTDVATVKLNDQIVGSLIHERDGKNIFTFDCDYIEMNPVARPILSLSFSDLKKTWITRHRLPTFFSNLLPEGDFRALIAAQHDIDPKNEFALLTALGSDLPGAVTMENKSELILKSARKKTLPKKSTTEHDDTIHFSLAGVQLKFSMLKEKSWFTLALPGDFIVKTPSLLYPHVPENEYSMMQLAKLVGISVPDTQLVRVEKLRHLPALNLPDEMFAYAVKRFDRENNQRIHIEDFAQVFSVKPEKKYEATNYDTMAKLILSLLADPEKQFSEFLRRLFFMVLIGNTDAHLKNWSLIYRDGVTAELSPGYDFVSTLPYLKNRELALNFAKQKNFYAIDQAVLKYFSKRVGVSDALVLANAKETVLRFKEAWADHQKSLPVSTILRNALKQHWAQLPIYRL